MVNNDTLGHKTSMAMLLVKAFTEVCKSSKYLLFIINNQKIHVNVYYVFYSSYSHQHISAAIAAIFRVILLLLLLLQEGKNTNGDVLLCFCNNYIILKMIATAVETC